MVKYKRLTNEEKFTIVTKYHKYSLGKLSSIINKPTTTIFEFYKRFEKRKTMVNKIHTGRRCSLNQDKLREIETYLETNPFTTIRQMKRTLMLDLHERTISRYIKKLKFKKFTALRKPKLQYTHKKERQVFCTKYKRWTKNHWDKVVFSDESSIINSNRLKPLVWRRGESLVKGKYVETTKFFDGYLKFWAFVSSNGVSKMVILTQKMTGKYYNDILKKNLFQEARRLLPNEENIIFQQDNHRCHKTPQVLDWLRKNGQKTLFWPSNSPDLSIIENIFGYWKKRVYHNGPYLTESTFRESCIREWENIPQNIIKSLYNSIPKRIQSCVERNYEVIKY
jgi:transposase